MASFSIGKKEVDVDFKNKGATELPIPAFSDISKAANDLLSKDFYHLQAANLEVKTKAPNGVNYTVKGKSAHEGPLSGSLEAKKEDKANGTTGTLTWNTSNAVDLKIELNDSIAKGLKCEALGNLKPDSQELGAKGNVFFKQDNFHVRGFFDFMKGPTATIDAVVGQQGFLVGGEAVYDVQKAAVTKYSAAVGYQQKEHTASLTAHNQLSLFAASYYHKINSEVEAGAKATYDSGNSGAVGLELASKYKLDPLTFVKGKVNDRGTAAVSYNTKVNNGFTFGIGASFDTQKLNEGTHKVGAHFAFEA